MKATRKKTLFAVLAVVTVLCVFACVLTACDSSLEEQIRELQDKVTGLEQTSTQKTVNIRIGEKDFEITTRMGNLFDVLNEMYSAGTISAFAYSGSSLDAYVTAVNRLAASDAERTYIAVYHDIDNFSLKGTDWQTGEIATVTVGGKTYFYSNVGCAILPLVDGASYCLLLSQY